MTPKAFHRDIKSANVLHDWLTAFVFSVGCWVLEFTASLIVIVKRPSELSSRSTGTVSSQVSGEMLEPLDVTCNDFA